MIELFNGALTLNQTVMRGLRESSDGVRRGFLLVLFVGLLVGTVNGISITIQNTNTTQAVQLLRQEFETQIDQIVLSSNDPGTAEVTRVINENKEPFFDLVEDLLNLPAPLPRPVGMAFQLLGVMISTPLSYLSSMLWAIATTHLVARQLGGQGRLQQMVALGSLSIAPHALDALAFIPGLGGGFTMVASIWGLVVLVSATSVAHRLDSARAMLAVFFVPLLLILLGLLSFCLLLAVLVGIAQA